MAKKEKQIQMKITSEKKESFKKVLKRDKKTISKVFDTWIDRAIENDCWEIWK